VIYGQTSGIIQAYQTIYTVTGRGTRSMYTDQVDPFLVPAHLQSCVVGVEVSIRKEVAGGLSLSLHTCLVYQMLLMAITLYQHIILRHSIIYIRF
jgi:hypothetical protein